MKLKLHAPTSDAPVVRMWFNTLIEFRDGKAIVLRSFSTPAKDSDVVRNKKPKKVVEKAKVHQAELGDDIVL